MSEFKRTRAIVQLLRWHSGSDQHSHAMMADDMLAAADRLEALQAQVSNVRAQHQPYRYYDLEDYCTNTSDEHREEHHHESADESGEFYCDQLPLGAACDICRDEDGDRIDWPCATIRALGKEND